MGYIILDSAQIKEVIAGKTRFAVSSKNESTQSDHITMRLERAFSPPV